MLGNGPCTNNVPDMACPVIKKIFHVRKAADRSNPALHQNDQIYIVWLVANILWPLVWWVPGKGGFIQNAVNGLEPAAV